MGTELFIPKLGQTVEEVTLVSWLVEDGAKVDFGQAILDVETDKAVFPVEANAKGVLHRGPFKEGDILPVLTVVAVIGKPEDKFIIKGQAEEGVRPFVLQGTGEGVAKSEVKRAQAEKEPGEKLFASPRARKLAEIQGVDLSRVVPTGGGGFRVAERDVVAYLKQMPKATPIAQKLAVEAGIDLQGVVGSGPRGRILKEDIERAKRVPSLERPMPMPVGTTESGIELPLVEVVERIPLKGVRAIIADRMGTSVHTTARVTLLMEVDATAFVEARTRLKEKVSEEWGFIPGYNDLLAKVVAVGLRKFPYMNARLTADSIEILGHVNIGMAVDTERGLLVPVIHDADRKNLRQFSTEFRDLVDRARKGRSLPDDLSGGTFTITNLGMYDVDAFTPVINLPEAAILGVGRIAAKPVVKNNSVEVRQMWTLCLVFDHRLVDGAPAARFLQYLKELIEEPYLLLAE